MQESSALAPPTFFLPPWARIAIACFMFAVAAVSIVKQGTVRRFNDTKTKSRAGKICGAHP